MEIRENPPSEFVRILKNCWKRIPTVQGAKLLAPDVVEYGCGKYGCVYPTSNPDVVLKLTTDRNEAVFAQFVINNKYFPPGIVKYYKAAKVGKIFCGEIYTGHLKGRKGSGLPTVEGETVYALWREAADNVGDTAGWRGLEKYAYAVSSSHHKIGPNIAKTLANLCKGRKYKSLILQGLEVISTMFDTENEDVAKAILYYLEKGVWIRDVNAHNVGEVKRGKKTIVAITDPGNVYFMTKRPTVGGL